MCCQSQKGSDDFNCFYRSQDAHPSEYITYLSQFQDAGPNLVKRSKILGMNFSFLKKTLSSFEILRVDTCPS